MTWQRVKLEERRKRYVDHVSGPWRVAQGYGPAWDLFRAGRWVGEFKSARAAKAAAGRVS